MMCGWVGWTRSLRPFGNTLACVLVLVFALVLVLVVAVQLQFNSP